MPRYNPTRRRFYVADKWISRARTADEMQIIREYHKELAIWETERAIAAVRGIENYAPEPQLGEAAIRLFEEEDQNVVESLPEEQKTKHKLYELFGTPLSVGN